MARITPTPVSAFGLLLIIAAILVFSVTPVMGAAIQVTVDTDPVGGPVNGDGCTLREAVENANDGAATYPDCSAGSSGLDTITFNSGISKITLTSGTFTGEMFVIDDLSITQPIILDGGGVTRIFRLTVGSALTLENMTMQNGFTAGAGGTILIDSGALTLLNCNFKDNKADGVGGAITMIAPADSSIDIANCNFENNQAGTEGGAIYKSAGGTLDIATSRFKDNKADQSGGALAVGGIGTITATAFQDNKAKGDDVNYGGGAIIFASEAQYNIVASGFAGNQATGENSRGGAIFSAFGTDLAIEYSHFGTTPIPLPAPFNTLTAANEATGSAGMGGAIYNRARLLVLSSSFIGNISAQHGGAIATDAAVDNDAKIANSTFDSNNATGNGGAVYQFGNFRQISILNTTITANTAASGGGIYNNEGGESVKLANSIIASNNGSNCAGVAVLNVAGNVVNGSNCPANTTILVGDPVLEALQLDFSLPVIVTYSRNIGAGSAASGIGDQDICALPPILNLDQRGLPRPQGGTNCDAGSVEGDSMPGEITVVRPGPQNVPDGSSILFGTTPLGTPKTIVFTVINDGQDPLTLGTVALAPTGFTINPYDVTNLSGGSSTTFSVTCTAAGDGSFAGTISFANSDGDENPFNFDVSCTVLAETATPTITPGGPTLTASPTPTATNTLIPTITPTPSVTITPGGPTLTPSLTPTLTSTPLQTGSELLENNSFEAKITGSLESDLSPWEVKNETGDKIRCTKAGKPPFARTGDCAFRFKGGAGENSSLKQQPDISLITFNVGDTLDWRVYYVATNSVANAKVKLRVKYNDNSETGKLNFQLLVTTDGSGYAEYFETYTLISADVAKIKVQINHASPAGKIYLDDVSLRLNQITRRGLIPLPPTQ